MSVVLCRSIYGLSTTCQLFSYTGLHIMKGAIFLAILANLGIHRGLRIYLPCIERACCIWQGIARRQLKLKTKRWYWYKSERKRFWKPLITRTSKEKSQGPLSWEVSAWQGADLALAGAGGRALQASWRGRPLCGGNRAGLWRLMGWPSASTVTSITSQHIHRGCECFATSEGLPNTNGDKMSKRDSKCDQNKQ